MSNASDFIIENGVLKKYVGPGGDVVIPEGVTAIGELAFDGFLVVAEGFFVDEFALLALHRGVADHTGGTADYGDGAVARALQMLEHHHAHEVAYVERVGGRVNAEVCRSHTFFEEIFSSGHRLVHHAAPGEFFYEIHILSEFLSCE